MPLIKRLIYVMYILIPATMIVMLLLSVGQGVGFARGMDAQAVVSSPLYFGLVYVLAFVVAPMLHERVPISGDRPASEPVIKKPYGYAVRIAALAAVGLVLALAANLIVFLLNRLS